MRLRVLRAERGLSLTEAAERAGIQRQTLALLERGERHPHDPTLAKIAKGYGVPVEELLEEPALAGTPGKDEAPKEAGPHVNEDRLLASELASDAPEEERSLHYLRLFRAFLHAFAQHWEQEPPTFRETAPLNVALIDTLGQGALDPPWQVGPKEAIGLEMLSDGLQRLHEVAAKAKDEERAGEQTQAPPPDVPADGAEADEEQPLRYVRGWGDFIDRLAQRWEAKPPQASKEIDPALGALAPLLDQRVFDLSGREGPSEAEELMRIRRGIERLAKIIQKVEEVEQGGAADNIESMAEYRERMKRSA
jgi:transcriptional regulator with XRE-family HTH domain